jgi:general secretion pathway protein H
MPDPGAQARGFTLVELLIAVAVMAVLTAAAVPALNAVTGANARSAAGELAGAMRYLFDTAALRHQTCRLALDLDERSWWAECTKDRVFAGREALSASDAAREAEEEEEDLAARFPDDRDAEQRRLLAKAKWGQFSDRIAKKRTLPGDAAFREVSVEHLREPATSGKAYVYFYAQGRAEEARVPIVDGDNVYSVLLPAFTGRARVVAGKPEVRR